MGKNGKRMKDIIMKESILFYGNSVWDIWERKALRRFKKRGKIMASSPELRKSRGWPWRGDWLSSIPDILSLTQ